MPAPPATIVVGQVTPYDDQDAKYIPPISSLDIIPDYMIMNKYENDGHTYMLGVTSTNGFRGDTAAFCKLAGNTTLWIADWTASQFHSQPDVPDPYSVNNKWVLLDVHLEPAQITVGPDGVNALYRISGTYVYGARKPHSNVFKDVNFGRPPWLDDTFDRTMPLDKLKKSLIDIQGRNPGGITLPPTPIGPLNPGGVTGG